jgi:hypothetical protein
MSRSIFPGLKTIEVQASGDKFFRGVHNIATDVNLNRRRSFKEMNDSEAIEGFLIGFWHGIVMDGRSGRVNGRFRWC